MGKKKATQQTTQTQNQNYSNSSTYGFVTPTDSDDVKRLRDFKFQVDPSIGYAFGSAKNAVGNSFSNPLGGFYSPAMRDAILRSSLADLGQREAQAKSAAYNETQGQRYAQQAAVAAMTAPRLVQLSSQGTGTSTGTGTGTTTQSGGLLESLLVGAAQGASGGLA